MSFRQSYANVKPIATTVIVIANDSALWRLRFSVITSRVKLFGAWYFAQVAPQKLLTLYTRS